MATLAGRRWRMVSVYSAVHFLVDFACAFLMFRSITGAQGGYLCVLIYNFCAFAMQMPLGIIADWWNRNFLFAILGCVLVAIGYGLTGVPLAAASAAGLGNAMFHLGGGIDVLNISEKKLGALGVFVSPGALGIYAGTVLGRGAEFSSFIIPPALAAAAALIFITYRSQRGQYPKNAPFSLEGAGSSVVLTAAACLFLVVCLRSFAGLAISFPWKGSWHWGLILLFAVVLGKTMGGFFADRFGVKRTSAVSLGVCTVLLLFFTLPPAGIIGVLLFNMTMPITLWALAKLLPGAKGFAFGLLTFGLFIGFLPVYLGVSVPAGASFLFAPIALISLLLLWAGLTRAKL